MALRCDLCGKTAQVGHLASYSKRRTAHRFSPNLRWVSLLIDGKKAKVKTCMKCLRSVKNNKISGIKYKVLSKTPEKEIKNVPVVKEEEKEVAKKVKVTKPKKSPAKESKKETKVVKA